MATPMTPTQWRAALRAEGVHIVEYSGWTTRGRDAATGKPFGPVHGVLNHHTAGTDSLKTVAVGGRPDLPAPLAHSHLAKNGTVTLVSCHRANHAGLAARNVYDAIVAEKSLPKPSRASGTVDGNDVFYGIEVENLGDNKDLYTKAQYDALVRYNAAICRHHDWGAGSVAGHLETSVEGKVDPRGPVEGYGNRGRFTFTMQQLRADVGERLKHPAGWSPGATTSTTSPAKETDMQLNDTVTLGDWLPQTWPDDKGLADKKIAVNTALGSTYGHSRAAHEGVDALRQEVADLRAEVAKLTTALTREA
ncbi:N-acetylmuramoyl-L-alanine amidase [Streptomyces sp. HGB0020]|uniref:N-acetylmuramoyl-L-alanine amidase n=1 Tax=Streptomyces sp. HGB0020 TaxID=1078086 RepID=UPI00034E6245|nr:N-acetylmuramoyl-L-alanine amidase [Streptomyces sp. HGB0020]EPD56348.1 hypothetical protein HMPREF1211_07468 [Streptomyces sp. HGB0020]